MDAKMITVRHSYETGKSLETISILVVDDDTTCLSIVAAILKKWKYQVVTVKHPIDALCTLRIKGCSFDLVVSDVHMPDMNGFELQQKIDEEFKLPVVLMSADDQEGVMLKGLESGAAFFIVKPISPEDLRDLWQYAVAKKKGKPIIEEEGNSIVEKGSNEVVECASSANASRQSKKEPKRKSSGKDDDDDDKSEDNVDSATPKKAKVVWTNALHNRFLEAIRTIGLERAVPKKILELMKVPGLTRENVASHLQKYRIFLKRVSDATYKLQCDTDTRLGNRMSRSSCPSLPPLLMLNKFRQVSQPTPEQPPIRSTFQPRLGGYVPLNDLNLGGASFPYKEDSRARSRSRLGYQGSHVLGNRGNLSKAVKSKDSPLDQTGGLNFRMEQNKYQSCISLHGGISSGLVSGSSSIQKYPSLTQATPNISINNGLSNTGIPSSSNILAYWNMGSSSNWIQNMKFPNSVYQIASEEQLDGLCHVVDKDAAAPNGFNHSNCSISEIQSENMIIESLLTGNSGYLAKEASSSSSFNIAQQVSPALTNSIQRESTSVPQLPAPAPTQPHTIGAGGEEDCTFGCMNKSCNFDELSSLQAYDNGGFSDIFLNQVNIQSPIQLNKQDGEVDLYAGFSLDSFFFEDSPQVLNHEQQHGEQVTVSNYCGSENQTNDYFACFGSIPSQQRDPAEMMNMEDNSTTLQGSHPSPSEQDDEEFLKSVFGPGPYEGDENLEDI